MTSQPGQQTIAIHILTNISGSKGNQAMKFGQLIEYNLTNIFLERSYTKCGGEIIPRPFFKKSKLSLRMNIIKFYIFCFYCLPSWGLSKVIETKLHITCIYLKQSFLKNKKRSGTGTRASFSVWFLKKNISLVMFFYLTKFQCVVACCNSLLTRLWRNKFWINLIFLNKPFFLHNQKFKTKI